MGRAINSKAWDFNQSASPDEQFIIFSAQRPGGQGLINLYVSYRRDGAWTPAANLEDIVNLKAAQYYPTHSPRAGFSSSAASGADSASPRRPDQ